jgi:undecaprenyl diphosphate synthase
MLRKYRDVAVIMDGNRRYAVGRFTAGLGTGALGTGSRKCWGTRNGALLNTFKVVTVYAFSTENWKRDPVEVGDLIAFVKYCERTTGPSIRRNIRVRVATSARTAPFPVRSEWTAATRRRHENNVQGGLQNEHMLVPTAIRGEGSSARVVIFNKTGSQRVQRGPNISKPLNSALADQDCGDVDVLITHSGQLNSYFFICGNWPTLKCSYVSKNWPELKKSDLLKLFEAMPWATSRFGRKY